MAVRTIPVHLPEDLYAHLAAQAQSVPHSRSTSWRRRPSPSGSQLRLMPSLSPALQAELEAMTQLSDDALWAIAGSTVNADKLALYDLLIERQNAGPLTPDGKQLLAQLRDEADALMVRKAHAYALLRQRGHTLPSLDDLAPSDRR